MKFFMYFGANWCRAALGISFIFDPDDREYAVAFFAGPLMFMTGWEPV
jgi:hypothetical protein